jgi:hypothetical protein
LFNQPAFSNAKNDCFPPLLTVEEHYSRARPVDGSSNVFIRRELYDSAPYYWVIVGIILLVLGTYLAVAGTSGHFVLGLISGAISCAWGLCVFQQQLSRKVQRRCSTCDENLQQA